MSQDDPRLRPASLFRPLFAIFDGISGRDRQKALSLRARLDEARQESVHHQKESTRHRKEVNRLRRELEQQENENQALVQTQNQLNLQLEQVQEQERGLQRQCDRLNGEKNKQERELNRQIQSLQKKLEQFEQEQIKLRDQGKQRQQELETLRQTNQKLRYGETQQQKQVQKLQRRESQLQQTLEQKQERLNQQRAQQREFRQEIEEYENWIQRIETENAELGEQCQSLEQSQANIGANLENTFNQLQAFNQRLRHEDPEVWQSFSAVWKSLNLESLLPITQEDSDLLPDIDSLDLSGWRLALVGGHDSTRRGVTEVLERYGLRHIIEVPPANQNKIDQGRVKEKIDRCDLVVVITGYLSHKMTKIIHNLYHQNALAGELLYLNCRGCSGVVRDIVAYVQTQSPGSTQTKAS